MHLFPLCRPLRLREATGAGLGVGGSGPGLHGPHPCHHTPSTAAPSCSQANLSRLSPRGCRSPTSEEEAWREDGTAVQLCLSLCSHPVIPSCPHEEGPAPGWGPWWRAGTTRLSVLSERDPGWPVPHSLQVQDPEGTDVRPAAHTLFCAGSSLLGDSPWAGWLGWEGPGDRILGRAAGGLEIAPAERTGRQLASVHGCRWTGCGGRAQTRTEF